MKDFEQIVSKGWLKFQSICDGVAIELDGKVEFPFSIGYQPSDGAVLECGVMCAPLKICTNIISSKGRLTLEDFKKVCI